MKKQVENVNNDKSLAFRPVRQFVPVPALVIDDHQETVPGLSDTVQKLYSDFVLGKLDPSQIGRSVVYDDENALDVDPFNKFGLTLEETTEIAERGTQAAAEVTRQRAEADRLKQEEAAKKQQEELKNQLRKEIEDERRKANEEK